jgi:hypothetical protein
LLTKGAKLGADMEQAKEYLDEISDEEIRRVWLAKRGRNDNDEKLLSKADDAEAYGRAVEASF